MAGAGPGQRSAIESPPMPLRLRMLPAPSPRAGPGRVAGPTAERAIELADDTTERSGSGAVPTWSFRSPTLRSPGCTRGWRASTAAGRSRTSAAPTGRGSTANGWRRAARPIAPGAQIMLGRDHSRLRRRRRRRRWRRADGDHRAPAGQRSVRGVAGHGHARADDRGRCPGGPPLRLEATGPPLLRGAGRDLRSPAAVRGDLARARGVRPAVGRCRRQRPRLQERRAGERRR